jgi:selenocysteine lyase/cysteine desulfurase
MNKYSYLSRRNFIKSIGAGAALISLWGKGAQSESIHLSPEKLLNLSSSADIDEENFWNIVRTQMMLKEDIIYLNNGGFGATPRMVFDALVEDYRMLGENPRDLDTLVKKMDEVRKKVADFLDVSQDEIALTRNTTEGMSTIAAGLPLKKGDEVLISHHEHPGGKQPWLMRAARDGIEVREIEIPTPPENPEQILNIINDAISNKTRVISVSHVTCTTGLILPVKQLCQLARDKGVLSVLDGAHPMGMYPFSIHDIDPDFFATSPHKWLDAPFGNGTLYVRKDKINMLWPMHGSGGWDGDTALRFEAIGTRSWPVTCALGEAIDFQNAIGRDKIEKRGRELATYFKKSVREIPGVKLHTSMDPKMSCSISSISIGDLKFSDVYPYLIEKYNIIARPVEEINGIRVSTHFYNTKEEVDACLNAIKEIAEKGITGLSASIRGKNYYNV